MPDKCQAHDQCMGKLQDDFADLKDDWHQGFSEIKDMLRDGRVVHERHELRINRLEDASGGWGWRGAFVRLLFGLLEKGIIAALILAWWASQQGYGG